MIRVQTDDVDIGQLIAAAKEPGTGAVVVFDGVVRDDGITEMELEAYGDVAVAGMEKIAREATGQFRLLHVDIIHRIGRLVVGENILVIVDDLALQDKPGMIIFEQPDLIDVNGYRGPEVGSDIIKIILALATVPHAVF